MIFDTTVTDQYFSDTTADEVLADLAARAEEGMWRGGQCPMWAKNIAEGLSMHPSFIEVVALRWAVNQLDWQRNDLADAIAEMRPENNNPTEHGF